MRSWRSRRRGLLRGQENRVLALRSSTSAVAIEATQTDPASPVASLQASLQQEVAAFPRPAKVRMEAAVATLGTLQQELAADVARPKANASVEEIARQLQSQLSARAKTRF